MVLLPPSYEDVRAAHARIAGQVSRTPVVTSRTVDDRVGAQIFFKCENLQRVGAFKFRGASNAVLLLSEEQAARGVATHSSGNHAQALALAARMRGIDATIVMPTNAPAVKRAAVAGYGARIVPCEPTLEARKATLAEVVEETGASAIPPYDDARIIAGQGTAALELIEEVPDLDMILAPIGGGGLVGGTALVATSGGHSVKVIACEPELADDAARGFAARAWQPALPPTTIADGLRTSVGALNFALLLSRVSDVVTVGEGAIVRATLYLMERLKMVVEPSGAVPFAALTSGKIPTNGRKIGIILSGGNVDLPEFFAKGASWLRQKD